MLILNGDGTVDCPAFDEVWNQALIGGSSTARLDTAQHGDALRMGHGSGEEWSLTLHRPRLIGVGGATGRMCSALVPVLRQCSRPKRAPRVRPTPQNLFLSSSTSLSSEPRFRGAKRGLPGKSRTVGQRCQPPPEVGEPEPMLLTVVRV